MKYRFICIICLGISFVEGYAQHSMPALDKRYKPALLYADYQDVLERPVVFNFPSNHLLLNNRSTQKFSSKINHLPGMFCKLEYKVETKSILAPRFRLGSLAYTEWMEGKADFFPRY